MIYGPSFASDESPRVIGWLAAFTAITAYVVLCLIIFAYEYLRDYGWPKIRLVLWCIGATALAVLLVR